MFNFLDTIYYGNTIGQWAIVLLSILLSVIVGRLLYWISSRWIKFLTRKTETELDDIIIDMVEEPVVFIVILIGIRSSINILNLPKIIVSWTDSIFQLLAVLTVAWLITRLYDALHKKYLVPLTAKTETDLDDQLLPVIKTGVKVTVWSLGAIIGLNNAGYDVGAILAGLGIGGLAFALAAQDSVANIFGGVTIFLQRPFSVGDRIEVEGVKAKVDGIGLRSSTLLDLYFGYKIIVPNKIFINSVVRNIDSRPHYAIYERLHLHHNTTLDQVELALKLIRDIAQEHEYVKKARPTFERIGDYSLEIKFVYLIKKWQPEDQETIGSDLDKIALAKTQMNLGIMKQFEAHNIKLAMPILLKDISPSPGGSIFDGRKLVETRKIQRAGQPLETG